METQAYLPIEGSSSLTTLEKNNIRSYPLDMRREWNIGRNTINNSPEIGFVSEIVGRNHGSLVNIDNRWYYIDKGSVNGTYINGVKLENRANGTSKPYMLKNGDVLRIDSDNLSDPDSRGVWMMFTSELLNENWKTLQLNEKQNVIIGRDEEVCNLVIPHSYISAKHLQIGFQNGRYYVDDCGSYAGTWLNNERIDNPVYLCDKDKISFCDCVFIYNEGMIFYNTNELRKEASGSERRIVLKADIKTKKVPNNSGHGEKEIIRNVNVEVKEGSLVALLGSSGAGKSTVMNCMNGMDTKGAQGDISYKGVDLLENFDKVKYLIGSVPQNEVFHPMLTVEEELREAAIIRLPGDTKRKEIKAHVDNTISQLKLDGVRKNKISKCSGGEKKRVNIAIELVADRQLLCLDEPDAGLDPGMKRELFGILAELAHKEGKTILVIIHDVSDIHMFDQVIMMTKYENVGRLAFSGSPAEAGEYFGTNIKEAYGLLDSEPEKYIQN